MAKYYFLIEFRDAERAKADDPFKRVEWFRTAVDIRNQMLTPTGHVKKNQVHTVHALDKLIDSLDKHYARIETILAEDAAALKEQERGK